MRIKTKFTSVFIGPTAALLLTISAQSTLLGRDMSRGFQVPDGDGLSLFAMAVRNGDVLRTVTHPTSCLSPALCF
jgi:hypothetical protein